MTYNYNLCIKGEISCSQSISGETSFDPKIAGDLNVHGSAGGGGGYIIGDGLKLDDRTNTLSVDTATEVDRDNTKPITSAAVYETVGNIGVLLSTI